MQQSPIRYAGKTNPIYFLAVHYLDFIKWVAGDVERVYSESTKVLWKSRNLPTEDGFSTVMKLKSGATALLETFWVLPTTRGKSAGRLEITGTKGAIFLDDYDRKIEIYDSNGVEYPDTIAKPTVFGKMVGTLNQEVSSFIECIINDTKPLVTGEDGLEAVKLCVAICESAEKEKIITLN
jgi:UDP-N-acetylglucosamine 3-dehydrogenase